MKANKNNPTRRTKTSDKPGAAKNDKLASNVQATLDQLKKDVQAGDPKAKEFQNLVNAFRKR